MFLNLFKSAMVVSCGVASAVGRVTGRTALTGVVLAAGTIAGTALEARAQLRQDQVLVIYDSRLADSLAVAEYYAGSLKVPGGTGNIRGKRPGVQVLNLAALSPQPAVAFAGDITYTDFVTKLRDPIRTYLTTNNMQQRIRCFVLTKGMPHRMQDSDQPINGDNPSNTPGGFINELLANDANEATVDSELTLLFQSLNTGELGASADSKSDGLIMNPYHKQTRPILQYINTANTTAKTFTAVSGSIGPLWSNPTSAFGAKPGDMFLVCRLDGRTVQNVKDSIDRAQNLIYNTTTAAALFDKDPNNFDDLVATTNGPAWPELVAGPDYADSFSLFTTDRRFRVSPFDPAPGKVRLDSVAGAANFFVGPNLAFAPGNGILVTDPVILLATYGSNHNGVPLLLNNASSGTVYATSFNYAPGAIFNTVESFNGRDFGGIGQSGAAQQQQLTDFIASGGTFGVGNAWEPLADTVADNRYLVQNFVLGNLSWGEAAYSSIPAISWMQLVIGDPLARATRTSEDLNASGRVSIDDLYTFEKLPVDINRSGAADDADRTLLRQSMRAPERFDVLAGRP